jgi:molybdopterin synthase sulfur carrier subunit
VKVSVRYFASVKEQLGKDAEEVELPSGVSTIGGVRAHLKSRGGAYEEVFADKRLVRSALNLEMVKPTEAVKAGDEVAFFPPVTGG